LNYEIAEITSRLVQLPFTEGLRTTYGERTACTILIVSVSTVDGLVGYGESVGLFHETAATFIDMELKSLLIGQDCRRIDYLLHRVEHLIDWNSWAAYPIAALDMALHDLKGKCLQLPVYELLGGKYRDVVAFTGLIHIHSADEDAATAKTLVDQGFTHLKVKVGLDTATDLRRLERIREVCGPQVRIRIDPNMAWTPRTAVHAIEQMAIFDLEYVEQPVPGWDIAGMAEVARSVSVPLCADESCQSPRDALELVEKRACEAFLVYLSEAGGITRARQILAIAQAAGIQCALGTWGEGAVGFAAGLHLAAASRDVSLLSDTAYGVLADDYIVAPFPIRENGGRVHVPEGHGLGVEPDPGKLDRYSELKVADKVFQQATDAVPRLRQFARSVTAG
jgi:L-alanine-DL-glutamate epimerase-like enolase superfamily enzyme